jgi:ribonuclease HI
MEVGLSLKLKLFIWLLAENKILTWKNLQKRGWKGPGICILCKTNRESSNHLFVNCAFTLAVWVEIKKTLNLAIGWNGNTVIESFKNWEIQNSTLKALSTYTCWFIWIDRNKSIFEEKPPFVQRIVFLTRSAMGLSKNSFQAKIPRLRVYSYPVNKILAWFDGASQNFGRLSGAGGVIKIDDSREYRWILNCGCGTNTREELMGAWATITLVVRLSITTLYVYGDSRTVIEWLNRRGDLRVANLDAWKDRIEEICPLVSVLFPLSTYFREANKQADQLSKKALLSCRGRIAYNLWVEGHEGPSQFIYL